MKSMRIFRHENHHSGIKFVTNKLWVFASKRFNLAILVHEALLFLAHVATGFLDVGVLYVTVDIIQKPDSVEID